MNIIDKDTSIEVITKSIYPELVIKLHFQIDRKTENFIFQSGFLETQDFFKVAPVYLFNNSIRSSLSIISKKHIEKLEKENKNTDDLYLRLNVLLNEKAINHIEKNRNSHYKKDVELRLNLQFQVLKTNYNSYYEIKSANNDEEIKLYDILYENIQTSYTIPASRWLQEFSEPLGIGKFLLVELKYPNIKPTTEFLQESLQRAIENTNRVLFYIKQGDWYKSIETSRKIFEIFKFKKNDRDDEERKNEIKKLFIETNLSDKAFESFYGSILNLFNYISKFEHEKDQNGQYLPKPIPQKEDAYYIYTVCIGIINLISSKIK